MIKSFLPLLAIAASTEIFPPTINFKNIEPMSEKSFSMKLKPDDIVMKLDTILVFTPYVNGKPQSIKYNINGKTKDVYFAAFSVSAIDKLKKDILAKLPIDEQRIAFVPSSLAVFDSRIRNLINVEDDNFEIVHIPDPDQISDAERLFLKQGYPEDKVNYAINNSPIIFCTKPSIIVTEKDKTSIPCSTDYKTIKNIVDMTKPKKKNWFDKGKKPEVVAMTLNQFIDTLKNSDDPSVKDLRVIPTPSSVKVVNEVLKSKETKNK